MTLLKFCLLLLVCMWKLELIAGGKVLFLLPLASKSHKNVFEPLIKEMANRGHEVVVVSPYAPSKVTKGIRELVPTNSSAFTQFIGNDPIKTRAQGKMAMMLSSFDWVYDVGHEVHQNKEFMDLLDEKFDLVYINGFLNDGFYGFVHKLGAPFVIVTSMAAPTYITSFTGNRLPPSFVPSSIFDLPDAMTFQQRIGNLAFNVFMDIWNIVMYAGKHEAVYRKYLGEDTPALQDIVYDASGIFMNSHFTLTFPRPTLPNVFEVGGMHCKPGQPLPKDIEDFVGNAKDGFIYFSLGSIIQANTLPENVRKIFVNVFSRLKQRVLWKWETEVMPDLGGNVKLLKWAPQQDILAHKNLKMFITHGGLLSTQEATFHGVPLLGIPIFGDQDLNMKKAERAGYALALEILELTEEILENAINRLLNEQKFTEVAKNLSALFRDQPETPLERAAFWSEYFMRHKGADHIKSAARFLNFFQYHSLDVIAVLTITILTFCWLGFVITRKIFSKLYLKFWKGKSQVTRNGIKNKKKQ